MPLETKTWNLADHIKTPEEQVAFLEAALEDHDIDTFIAVLGIIAKTQGGATNVARGSGVSRRTVYSALRKGSNPTVRTLDTVMRELGLRLSVQRDSDAA